MLKLAKYVRNCVVFWKKLHNLTKILHDRSRRLWQISSHDWVHRFSQLQLNFTPLYGAQWHIPTRAGAPQCLETIDQIISENITFCISTKESTHQENMQRKVFTEVRDGKRGKIRFFLSNSLSQSNFIYKVVPMYKSITCKWMSFGFCYQRIICRSISESLI